MTEDLDPTPPCAFCGARLKQGVHLPDPGVAACQGCCERLARLLAAADYALIHSLWELPERDPRVRFPVKSTKAEETHLDLAAAYLEMGLVADAFAEAALALERLPEALGLLLHPRLVRPDTVRRLRALLYPA